MILKQEKVIKLHLECFRSGNFAPFHLKLRNLNRNETVHDCNGENQTRTERYMNVTARAKISILPCLVKGDN